MRKIRSKSLVVAALLALHLCSLPQATALGSSCSCDFIRADANNDGYVDLNDVMRILGYLYSGLSICNKDSADVDDNGAINTLDSNYLLCWLFGGSGCAQPPGAPKSPYPAAGCDCTPDNLENCCSPPTGGSNLSINSVYSCASSGNTWDSVSSCNIDDYRTVSMSAQNGDQCGHADSAVFWDVKFLINDPLGIDSSALTKGCVQVKTQVRFRASYLLGAECFEYECEPWVYNQLGLYPSSLYDDYEFTFVDPSSPWLQTVLPTTSGTYPTNILMQYAYEEPYCFLETIYEVNQGDFNGVLSDDSGNPFDCKILKYYEVKNIEFAFDRFGNPDLAETEAIGPGGSLNYSVRLMNMEYDWCDP